MDKQKQIEEQVILTLKKVCQLTTDSTTIIKIMEVLYNLKHIPL